MGKVVSMRRDGAVDPITPWGLLGFKTERDMLLDDFKTLDERLKASSTTATAVASLSKRKHDVFDMIKQLDSDERDPDSILDDSVDEKWDG